jgi:hypothetical protein
MELLTWSEFKKLVEDAGVEDDYEIEYIDISYPDNEYSPIEVFANHEKRDFKIL